MTFSDITILIDIDDTLIELLPAWCKWLNELYDFNVKLEEVTNWDISKFFPTLTPEEVFEPLYTDYFWKTVKPKDESVKYVKQLIDDGFNVYLCTSTDYKNVRPKFEYVIMKYFPFICWRQIIVACRKQMIKADFLIDDGVHNHESGDYFKILMSAPHNRGYDTEANGIVRSDSWKSAYDTVISQAKKMIGVKQR